MRRVRNVVHNRQSEPERRKRRERPPETKVGTTIWISKSCELESEGPVHRVRSLRLARERWEVDATGELLPFVGFGFFGVSSTPTCHF